jgi:sec-independent protein translocase protein TatA
MLRSIGLPELLVIATVAILLFGGRRFAEFGKGLGESISGFKKAMRDANEAEKELKKS